MYTGCRRSRVDSHGGNYTAIGVYYTRTHTYTNVQTPIRIYIMYINEGFSTDNPSAEAITLVASCKRSDNASEHLGVCLCRWTR